MAVGIFKLLALTLGLVMMYSCNGQGSAGRDANYHGSKANPIEEKKIIASVVVDNDANLHQGESALIKCNLKENAEIDSILLYMNGERVAEIDTAAYEYKLTSNYPTGRTIYRVEAYQNGTKHVQTGEFTVYAASIPQFYGYKIIKVYPHDANAYTQGLLFDNGVLYESTGLEGHSSLRKVEIATGKVLKNKKLADEYFAEGLVLLNDKLYQLTWQNNKAFVYDVNTFEQLHEFGYGGEGWGITTDGKLLYMSDGTDEIRILNPETFKKVGSINVYTDNSKVMYLNELEWINGEIWANVYTTNAIIRIDPRSGAVKGVIDMSGLLTESDINSNTDVLNGIAYDEATGRIFVTGKNWNKLFEIEVLKK